MIAAPVALVAPLTVIALAACGGVADEEPTARPRKSLGVPTDRPWVSVAVDNHFHDVHAEDDITLTSDRAFVVKNQGRNLHNVTIPEIGFSRDIRPGEQIEFSPVGKKLPPGTYDLFCKYHASEGMAGRITVTAR